jgi:hypothetical protein
MWCVVLQSRSVPAEAVVEAATLSDLESAHAAAQSALMAEADLLRRQKQAAEESTRRLEAQVSNSAQSISMCCVEFFWVSTDNAHGVCIV